MGVWVLLSFAKLRRGDSGCVSIRRVPAQCPKHREFICDRSRWREEDAQNTPICLEDTVNLRSHTHPVPEGFFWVENKHWTFLCWFASFFPSFPFFKLSIFCGFWLAISSKVKPTSCQQLPSRGTLLVLCWRESISRGFGTRSTEHQYEILPFGFVVSFLFLFFILV